MDKSDRWNKQATRNPICRESQTPRDMTQDFLQLAPLWFHPCVRRHMYCSSLPVQRFGLWWARYRKSPAVKWLFSIRKSWWIFSTSFTFASFTLHRVNSISPKKITSGISIITYWNSSFNFPLLTPSLQPQVSPWRSGWYRCGNTTPRRPKQRWMGTHRCCVMVPSHVPEEGLKICVLQFLIKFQVVYINLNQPQSTQEPLTSARAHWAPSPRLWIPHAWTPSAPELHMSSRCRFLGSKKKSSTKSRGNIWGNGELWGRIFLGITVNLGWHPSTCGSCHVELPHRQWRGSCCANPYHPGKGWFKPWRTNSSTKFLCKNAKSQQLVS